MRIQSMVVMAIVFAACGSARHSKEPLSIKPRPVKMRHQILFVQDDDEHVFEGYLILADDALLVKAFAGPGIDLFTIARDSATHFEQLHIPSLADRIDIKAVSEDIARVYLGGCNKPTGPREVSCDFFGEKMVEVYDTKIRLTKRQFPDAHGIGLEIHYEEYQIHSGRAQPKRITLSWGTSKNRMVILLVDFELLSSVDPTIFKGKSE